ncbi:MAG: hypothetical protein MO852_17295 [Candidatus Devosia euplotis]|nr:hypothetical protein [Candidatus Devosia euplotis]
MKPTDRRLTPEPILAAVRRYAGGPIAFDPCTEPDNPTGALRFCHPGETVGAIPLGWAHQAQAAAMQFERDSGIPLRTTIWDNPPFSNREPWDLQAIEAAEQGVSTFVFAAYEGTSHIDRLNGHATARCDFYRHVRCVDPATGKRMDVARAASTWLLGGDLTDFARCFGTLGTIIPLDTVRALTALGGTHALPV